MTIPMEREAARRAGHKLYHTGRPCHAGHVAARYTQTGMCRTCNIEQAAAWKRKNPERYNASNKLSAARNAEKIKGRQRANYERHKARRWIREGISPPTRPRPDGCEICSQTDKNRKLAIDHVHATGKFRGWLCFRCNSGIGRFEDDVALLRKAIDYLERNK